MNCRNVEERMADLLLEPETVPTEVRAHVASCADCGKELESLRATMGALDAWEAPEVSPYFDGRMAALLREEKQAPPAGWFERMRARLLFGNNLHLRPIAAGALGLAIMVGGGLYAGFSIEQPAVQPAQGSSPVIRDLQSLDENQQVFQQMNAMDQDAGDSGAPGSSL